MTGQRSTTSGAPMRELDAIRAALLESNSAEPQDALIYDQGSVIPRLAVRVRPFLYLPSASSGSALVPIRFAKTRPARVTDDYAGTGLVPVLFDDENLRRIVNGAGFKVEELHRPECTCSACR